MATKKKSAPAKRTIIKKESVKKSSKKVPTANPGFVDHFVTIEIANEMIGKGQAAGLLPPMQFSADCVREILAQKGVVFLRIYAVINNAGNQTYLLTGGSADHRRIDVVRKGKKLKSVAARGRSVETGNETINVTGDMNIAQVCDPEKKTYTQMA
jgi:hypothetical protein